MKVAIKPIDNAKAKSILLEETRERELTHWERQSLNICTRDTRNVWIGLYDGKLVCVWGLIPPTILSDSAHLWLYVTDEIEHCKFLFIRHSQIHVQEMLKEYPSIVGCCEVQNKKAIKWVEWLGAKFGKPVEGMVPFLIRAQNG